MENKINQKIVKRVVMFVAALFLLFPGMSFADIEEDNATYVIDLEDYGVKVYDVTLPKAIFADGDYEPDNLLWVKDLDDDKWLEIETVQTMDTKGKLTGIETLWLWDGAIEDDNGTVLVTAELSGTVKRNNPEKKRLEVKTKSKGTGSLRGIELKYKNKVKKQLSEDPDGDPQAWVGEATVKTKLTGEKTVKDVVDVVADPGISGEAEVFVENAPGTKNALVDLLVEDSETVIWNDNASEYDYDNNTYLLTSTNVKTNNKGITSLKAKDETKGLDVKLKIDEAIVEANETCNDDWDVDNCTLECTEIKGKVFGQKLKYKK